MALIATLTMLKAIDSHKRLRHDKGREESKLEKWNKGVGFIRHVLVLKFKSITYLRYNIDE